MSRVVHTRIEDRTIALCFMLASKHDLAVEGMSVASAVRIALSAMLEGLVLQGFLNDITESEAIAFLNERIGPSLVIDQMPRPIFQGEEEGLAAPDLTSEIDAALETVQSGGITAAAPDNLPDAGEDFEDFDPTTDRLSIKALKAMAPKDAILEDLDESNLELVFAVESVYSVISRDLWGSDQALTLIKRYLDK